MRLPLSAIGVLTGLALSSTSCISFSPHQLREKGAKLTRPRCRPDDVLAQLSKAPPNPLTSFDRTIDVVTNEFKKMGIFGWTDTGCSAKAVGTALHETKSSASGFWTIDVKLRSFRIRGRYGPQARFIRIEVAPGTKAHQICEKTRVRSGMTLAFSGPVLIDHDGPFLEVHPDRGFRIVPPAKAAKAAKQRKR